MDNLIDINIIEVNDPGDFLGIEIPSVNKTSAFGIFHQMVQEMNEYCNNDQLFFNDKFQPQLGKEVYAGFRIKDKTWHRVKVENILQTSRGRQCICYLVDYGQMENIPVNEIRKIPEEFRHVPHQVRRYALYGIQALTLALDAELMAKDTPCVVWDLSAKEYLKDLNKESTKSQVEIKYVNTAGVKYVRLYLNTPSGRICVNDDLVKKKYATVSPVYQLDNKNVNNADSTQIVPCRNLSETKADINNFIKLISNTSKPQNNAKAQKYLTEVSSSDEVNTVSNDMRRNAVSDSETVTQKLKIEKPKVVVQQSMNKLEELLKCLPSANYKSDHTPDPDMPIPFQRARLPKIALQKAKPTSEAEHTSLPQPSIPKSPVKTVISPVKTTPLEIPSPSIIKKSLVRRLSDTSVVNKTNNGYR
ncbi:putative ATP-dependent RNA helicase TDRD12 [Patella vulgata]|uniref:putative ATP-dependent RNA helicase TDRD12 n=1 Tax=Patella vulgata TaxID=6465 RepID=UPI00217FDA3E|nr:putative ATP-dependent RNA helicase TDRD12 [Patella vulgata]